MKKVNLDKLTKSTKGTIYIKDKLNWIDLGNGVKRSFTNYKNAQSFLTEVNRQLNIAIDQINLVFMDLFREYRIYYRSMQDFQAQSFISLVTDIDRLLTRSITHSQSANGNHFTFHYLLKACHLLKLAVEILVDRARSLNNWHEKRTLEAYNSRILQIEQSINVIGKE